MTSSDIIPQRKPNARLLPKGFDMRVGTEADIPDILPHMRDFFEESHFKHFGAEYSEAAAERYLQLLFEHHFHPAIFATVDDKIVGWLTFQYDVSIFKKPVAVLNTIFVAKPYRRSLIGRMLLAAALDIAKDEQAATFVAPVNSGTGNIRSLENMLSKAGFFMSGYIMSREL